MTGVIVQPRGEQTIPAAASDAAQAGSAAVTRTARLNALLTQLALIVGWWLRLQMLHAWPLREDEAIYSVWARSVWNDPWFLSTWPDKPPLFLWLQALALHFLGTSPAAARTVSLAASVATIPVVASIARRMAGDHCALLAAWLMALSPFAVSFAATAYTDSLLVFMGMLSLALIVRGRPLSAGVALGAAIMTKQQGVLFAPLVMGAGLIVSWAQQSRVGWLRFFAGSTLIVAPILLWDASRWGSAPSPWDLGVRNYGALTLAPLDTWGERLRAWGVLAWLLGAGIVAWLALAAALAVGLLLRNRQPLARSAWWLWWWLLIWSGGFLVAHLVSTVPAWDRYLLPLAPMLALLVAVPASAMLSAGMAGVVVALGAALMLVAPAWSAARGDLPIGADHGDYAGLDEAFAWAESHARGGDIVYHRVLGWQARFALHDAAERGEVELRWFPSAIYLADNAAKSPHRRRYLIEPAWAQTRGLYPALAALRLRSAPVFSQGQIGVWEISSQPGIACAGCFCAAPAWSVRESDAPPAMSVSP